MYSIVYISLNCVFKVNQVQFNNYFLKLCAHLVSTVYGLCTHLVSMWIMDTPGEYVDYVHTW